MNTTTTPLKVQDQLLDTSCHLALDLMGVFALGHDSKHTTVSLKTSLETAIRTLESAKTLMLHSVAQKQEKLIADIEHVRAIQARYRVSKNRHPLRGRTVLNRERISGQRQRHTYHKLMETYRKDQKATQ